jgi:hypothetical protein
LLIMVASFIRRSCDEGTLFLKPLQVFGGALSVMKLQRNRVSRFSKPVPRRSIGPRGAGRFELRTALARVAASVSSSGGCGSSISAAPIKHNDDQPEVCMKTSLRGRIALLLLLGSAAACSQAQGRFTVSADGQEVTDTSTQLTWRRCAEGMEWKGDACSGKLLKFSYAGAKKRAASVSKTDAKAWRVPTRAELTGLIDKKALKKPKIDRTAFPTTPTTPFWASRPGTNDDLNAWLVSFSSGKVTGNVGQAKFALRLVRSSS